MDVYILRIYCVAKKSFRINISIYLNLETFSIGQFGTI